MDKIYKDTVTLIAGHAIMIGHKPENLSFEQISKKLCEEPQNLEQFGLFDRSTPNYTTYYPDVTAEDLKPSEDEFIEPMFRMLSNVTVHAKHNPIYFSEEVLKASMSLLIGQTINIDHEMAVGNAIGSIKSVEWQDSYKAGSIKVPGGINAVLKIDGKSNPRIARGIMMDPPSIHSNSVTVSFEWIKSHPTLEDSEFRDKLGTFDKSGKLIQRVVTKVLGYYETSLVGHGADPFAQKIVDGKIVNPKSAKNRYPLSEDLREDAEQFFSWDWKQFHGTDIISNNTTILEELNNKSNNNQEQENMEVILKMLEAIFGLEANSLTEDNCEQQIKDIKIQFDQFKTKAEEVPAVFIIGEFEGLEAITAEFTRLQEVVKGIPEDLPSQLAMATAGKTLVDQLRANTTRLYKLTLKEDKTEDPNMLALIVGADFSTLQSLHKQYDELTEDEFKFTCADCGSHEVTRASADSSGEGTEDFVNKTNEEVIENLTAIRSAKMTIFGDK